MFILVCLVSFNFNRNNLLEKCTLSLNRLKRALGYTVMSITRRLGPRCRVGQARSVLGIRGHGGCPGMLR